MPLPVGKWTINGDGNTGTLVIGTLSAPDSSGNVFFLGTTTFTISGATDSITGVWDEAGQAISFLRLPASDTDFSVFQVYSGTLYSFPPQENEQKSAFVFTYTLAGDLRTFSINKNTTEWDGLVNPTPPLPGLWCAQQKISETII